jgi:hypothetical protein
MALDWKLADLAAYIRTWSATNRFVRERGFDPVAGFEQELAPLWGAGTRRVRWPLSLRVGRSRRSG